MHTHQLRILCIRHGITNYTGVFPDLTNEGAEHVSRVANTDIREWMESYRIHPSEVVIVSSPAARAHGTASIIAREIGSTKPIFISEHIDAMQWRDKKRCSEACNGLTGKGYIDYETEPVFMNPKLFETPNEVRARWYAFLAQYINLAFDSPRPQDTLLVSHYELFCNITRDMFGIVATKDTALQYAEPIALSISLTNDPRYVHVAGVFREIKISVIFDLVAQKVLHL